MAITVKGYRRDHSQYARKALSEPDPHCSELIGARGEPYRKLETSEGDITVVLFADKSPKTVENFLAHVDEGFYENTVFHRIIDNFMVQGGGFDVDLNQKKTERKVINESKNRLHNDRAPWPWHGPATRIPLAANFSSTSATILDLTGHLSNRIHGLW